MGSMLKLHKQRWIEHNFCPQSWFSPELMPKWSKFVFIDYLITWQSIAKNPLISFLHTFPEPILTSNVKKSNCSSILASVLMVGLFWGNPSGNPLGLQCLEQKLALKAPQGSPLLANMATLCKLEKSSWISSHFTAICHKIFTIMITTSSCE